jgi:hypothetical protein
MGERWFSRGQHLKCRLSILYAPLAHAKHGKDKNVTKKLTSNLRKRQIHNIFPMNESTIE